MHPDGRDEKTLTFLGLFPKRAPAGRPARRAVLRESRHITFNHAPPGRWYPLAQSIDRPAPHRTVPRPRRPARRRRRVDHHPPGQADPDELAPRDPFTGATAFVLQSIGNALVVGVLFAVVVTVTRAARCAGRPTRFGPPW